MTIDPSEIASVTPAESTAVPGRKPFTWRSWVGIGVWVALTGCVFALCVALLQMFGMAVGNALHAEVTAESQLPLFWGLVAICIVLALAGIAAIVAYRWVALVLVILVGAAGGFLTAVVFTNVQSIVAPVEQSDPQPMPCQCYSGSFCDCPGG